mmetsp:Transcript_41982/g.88159  ORF Transcript_41982/g.88159 Transcript_41982/m.88159 type:complete len:100 (+) Transcript_41982:667-966(+)
MFVFFLDDDDDDDNSPDDTDPEFEEDIAVEVATPPTVLTLRLDLLEEVFLSAADLLEVFLFLPAAVELLDDDDDASAAASAVDAGLSVCCFGADRRGLP